MSEEETPKNLKPPSTKKVGGMSEKLKESFEVFEPYVKEWKELTEGKFKGAKLYRVRCLHVSWTGNRRYYSVDELLRGSRSLSDRPIGFGATHETAPSLPYPDNTVLDADYNSAERFTEAIVRVSDSTLNRLIATKQVTKVSIEGRARSSEEVNGVIPKGCVFTRLLFVLNAQPGDLETSIEAIAETNEVTFSELIEPKPTFEEVSKHFQEALKNLRIVFADPKTTDAIMAYGVEKWIHETVEPLRKRLDAFNRQMEGEKT